MGGLRRLKRKGAGRYAVEPLRGRPESHGKEKLSAVILDFARPFTDNVGDDQFRIAIEMAIFCWNIALLPEDQQERQLRRVAREEAEGKPAGFADDMMTWSRLLIHRKKTLFAHDRRMVMDFTIEDDGDEFHLSVVSTPAPSSPSAWPGL